MKAGCLPALIAGTLARTQNFQPHQRKECMNDALIYLSATKLGLPVVTANRVEFDLIQQIAPWRSLRPLLNIMPRNGRGELTAPRMPSPDSGYVRIVCAELYGDRAGHDAYSLLRQARQQYFRPDAVGHEQGAKAIGG